MTIEIARLVPTPVADAAVRRIIAHVIARTRGVRSNPGHDARRVRGRPGLLRGFAPRNDGAISVAFVSPREMRRLNQTYHGEDRVTDVLAFPFSPSFRGAKRRGISHPTNPKAWREISRFARDDNGWDLGELVICPVRVRADAKRAGEPFRRELARVLVHGTLHLLGHDHAHPRDAERMFALQESIVHRIERR